jgi:NADPH:quinone reductase-like Zn-dependent oxidoreductase
MKAIVCTAYGSPDVLKLEEVEQPRPKAGEVLVRVRATTASRADCEIRRFEFPAWIWLPVRLAFGVVRPRVRILGQEFAGEVEALGDGVSAFAPGDRVYGTTGIGLGAYAEFVCAGGRRTGSVVGPMPAALGYAEAAAVPYGAMEALRFLRKAGIGAGQRVLVIGAGGSFGTCAVQLARHAGAEVVAVDSGGKLGMLRELGADAVIDYRAADVAREVRALTGKRGADVVVDSTGAATWSASLRSAAKGGRIVTCGATTGPNPVEEIRLVFWNQLTILGSTMGSVADWNAMLAGLSEWRLRPVVDSVFPLADGAAAYRRLERRAQFGKIVLAVSSDVPVTGEYTSE